jgi:hypothetical protein
LLDGFGSCYSIESILGLLNEMCNNFDGVSKIR